MLIIFIIAAILVAFFLGVPSIKIISNPEKYSDEKNNAKTVKKRGLLTLFSTIVLIISLIMFAYIAEYGSRNVGKPQETKYEKCSMCGDKVPEDDMRGKWCKDCQNDAFGDDGWYDKIK